MAIAIVSAGIRFPGAAHLEEFWSIVAAGRDLSREVSAERWPQPAAAFQGDVSDRLVHDRLYEAENSRESAEGLGLSQAELDALDPLFHLALGAGREALARARRAGIETQRIGLILGNIALPTAAAVERTSLWLGASEGSLPRWAQDPRNNFPAAEPALVLARALGIGGQVYTLDAACASSLYALKFACDALERREQDLVLAGGLSRPFSLYTQIGFTALQALSPRGQCFALDARADGLMVGEGAGIFGLKRLADARADGDRILGVIRGIGLSNDREGRLMAPSSAGQLRAMQAAYAAAGWQVHDVDSIECHATGTPLGDSTEIASLKKLWAGAPVGASAVLGSVKPNVGHMLTAAGAAGLAKLLMAFQKETHAPTANFHAAPAAWRLEESPFRILQKAEAWPRRPDRPRRAALSGFGFGGINAHLLLEEYVPERPLPPARIDAPASEVVLVAMSSLGLNEGPGYTLDATTAGGLAIDKFELGYQQFRIPPSELAEVLPQQLLGLLAADRLGLPPLPEKLTSRAACLVGLELDPATHLYASRWQSPAAAGGSEVPPLSANRVIGSLGSIVASRIARELRFGGPAFTLAAGELSGLQALRLAAEQIRRGELSLALVLGVDLSGAGRGRAQILESLGAAAPVSADRGIAFCLMQAEEAEALGLRPLVRFGAISCQEQDFGAVSSEEPALYFRGAAAGLAAFYDALATEDGAGVRSFSYQSRAGSHCAFSYERLLSEPYESPVRELGTTFRVARWDHKVGPRGLAHHLENSAPAASLASPVQEAPAWLSSYLAIERGQIESHQQFLQYRNEGDALLELLLRGSSPSVAAPDEAAGTFSADPLRGSSPEPEERPLFDFAACQEFARGSIARVFGPAYAEIDGFPTRVRLPDDKLLLCQRVMHIEGEPLSLGPGLMITEHDVLPGAWYLENGQMPTSIAVESGQADLMLAAYLGADFRTRGEAVYRLLDAKVSFYRQLPRVGETIRYVITIKRFFEQGGLLFFHFEFEASIAGEPLMSMREGCAGFFTQAALDAGRGVKRSPLQLKAMPGHVTGDFRPLAPLPAPGKVLSLDDAAVEALRKGDYAAAFGASFAPLRLQDPSRLPDGPMRLVQRVLALEPTGGRFGLGRIIAEADIVPDAWFLTCHFIDDQVMPGTLMYECCLQTLRILTLRLGWVGESSALRFEPRQGVSSQLKCRGQVLASTQRVRYEIEIKEIGYGPDAYVICDALMSADGRPIVDISDMSLELPGCDAAFFAAIWAQAATPAYDTAAIYAFAAGKPSDCFGPVYRPFDEERKIARLPRPPYQFLDSIESIEGPFMEQHVGTRLTAFYAPPADAWYWSDGLMPFAVLVEVALQPCGFMAAYMGSALLSEADLSFRNLGGEARLLQLPQREGGPLWIDVSSTKISRNGDMIIQEYDFLVRNAGGPVYEGKTAFGFFTRAALAQQVGLRQQPRWQDPGLAFAAPYPTAPGLPQAPLLMVDRLAALPAPAGRYQAGVLYGQKKVRAWNAAGSDARAQSGSMEGEWFFDAHFYQDPVMPGSLGLEALEQVLKAEAHRLWPAVKAWTQELGTPVRWTYRGQVVPTAKTLHYEVQLRERDDAGQRLLADAWLYCDGLPIYSLEGLLLRPLEADAPRA